MNFKSMNFKSIYISTVSAILLTACGISKEYVRSESAERDDLYRETKEEISMAEWAWRDYFTDKLLQSHITTALENNNDYRLAAQQILKAEAQLKQSKAGKIPTLSTEMSIRENLTTDNASLQSLTGTVAWEADLWGKIQSNIDAATIGREITAVNRAGVRTTLIAGVASTYLQLLTLDKQLDISESNIAIQRDQITTLEALKDAGLANQVSIDQSKAQLFLMMGQSEVLRQSINSVENAFSILLGMAPNQIERGALDSYSMEMKYATGVPAQLLEYRPDVKVAELMVIEALEMRNAAKANFYPTLIISATGGLQSLKLSDWVTPESALFSVLGSLTQPILNRRAIRTEYELAQIAQQEALIGFEQSLLVAGKEVSDALYSIETTERQASIMEQNLTSNERAVSQSEELFKQGMINYLDLLITQQSKLASEQSLALLKSQHYTSRIQLYKTLGGGVK